MDMERERRPCSTMYLRTRLRRNFLNLINPINLNLNPINPISLTNLNLTPDNPSLVRRLLDRQDQDRDLLVKLKPILERRLDSKLWIDWWPSILSIVSHPNIGIVWELVKVWMVWVRISIPTFIWRIWHR